MKSSADCTKGSVNGLCNRAVEHGKDVTSVEDMIEVIRRRENGKIQISPIVETDVKFVETLIALNLIAIPNTRQIFYMNWHKQNAGTLYLVHRTCMAAFTHHRVITLNGHPT